MTVSSILVSDTLNILPSKKFNRNSALTKNENVHHKSNKIIPFSVITLRTKTQRNYKND